MLDQARTPIRPNWREFAWAEQLRSHCELLFATPGLMNAVTVASRLEGESSAEAIAYRVIGESLAGEFGFEAQVRIAGRRASVRFSRRKEQA
jgi:hypothetical protein